MAKIFNIILAFVLCLVCVQGQLDDENTTTTTSTSTLTATSTTTSTSSMTSTTTTTTTSTSTSTTTTTTPSSLLVLRVTVAHPTPFTARLYEGSNTWDALKETFEDLTGASWEKINVWEAVLVDEGVFELEFPVYALAANVNSTAVIWNLYDMFMDAYNAKVEETFYISALNNVVWLSSTGEYELSVVTTTTAEEAGTENSAPKASGGAFVGAILSLVAAVAALAH